ncbi:MAG: fused MFS/spermidine synthase [Coriobacteriia bacterium]|nr:fused MFS/spermidine synthase [Coriobacteriia bacterium]
MRPRVALPVAATALSAFLLFALELYAGRIVLPVFGGSPAVWTTALCFFTGAVFLGYLHAHLLVTRMQWRTARVIQLVVVGVALASAALAPEDLAQLRVSGMPPALNVLLVLAAIVGLPAFLLATTTPLVSARFAARGDDPWWLYAASNAASLGGLLAYPLLIEPWMPLSAQRTGALALLGVLAALLCWLLISDASGPALPEHAAAPPLPRKRQLIWLLAACMPAGLLSATTTLLATDHASAPMLWIGPLGVYLGSFIVAFSARGRRILPLAERLVPAAVTLLWIAYVARIDWPVLVIVPMVLLSYGVLAVAVHGRLAEDRPGEEHLTRFYLWVSAGGVLATGFVALAAPVIFEDVFEYPLLLIGALVAIAALTPHAPSGVRVPGATLRAAGARLLPLLAFGLVVLATMAPAAGPGPAFVGILLVLGAIAVVLGTSPRALAISTVSAIAVALLLFAPHPVERVRSFFGVTDIIEAADGAAFAEIHGTTLHGLQYRDERASEPTAYFVREGPLGDVMADLQQQHSEGADIGVVGLGVGTIAAYARPNDSLTYFEIDQTIVDLARDDRYFTYLADAATEPEVLLGDGRLLLAESPSGQFDLLILDAFSSDAVPTHLLTREAMDTYARTLRPGGMIAFQLTNRHFDLVGAVAETARSVGLDARTKSFEPGSGDDVVALPSTWLVVGDSEDVSRLDALGWDPAPDGPVLTDDYHDVRRLLKNAWRPAPRPII